MGQRPYLTCCQKSRLSQLYIIKYSCGQLVHSRGDNKPGLSIVKTGAVSTGVYGIDGTFIMASMLGEGQAFGEFTLFTDLPRTHDVSAAVDSELYQISGECFLSLSAKDPEILNALLKSTLIRTHMLLELLDAMRRLPILERVAKMMLTMSYTSGVVTHIQCKQSELAFSLGVSRVTLGKALKQLSDMGLIDIAYRRVSFTDRQKIETWLELKSTTPLLR